MTFLCKSFMMILFHSHVCSTFVFTLCLYPMVLTRSFEGNSQHHNDFKDSGNQQLRPSEKPPAASNDTETSENRPLCIHGSIHDGKCVCELHYEGPACQWPKCFHGVLHRKKAACLCDSGWAGTHCDSCLFKTSHTQETEGQTQANSGGDVSSDSSSAALWIVLLSTFFLFMTAISIYFIQGSRYADQLYTDLLYHYLKNVRPVANASEVLTVGFGSSLIRIIDVIDIEFFPYDEQKCQLKFGGWTHDGYYMDMQQIPVYKEDESEHLRDHEGDVFQYLERGMDLSYFHRSAEWDVVNLTSERHAKEYPGCCGQVMYIDVRFNITLRRKPLFYTANLVSPCMLIAILTTFIFFLPSQSSSKITFSICILVTLSFLFLVLIDLIPPTSLVIPLFGKYLLFTIVLVGISIFTTVVTLNLYNRTGATHSYMPIWMKWLFLEVLPRFLWLKPYEAVEDDDISSISDSQTPSPATQARRQSSIYGRRPSPYFLNINQFAATHVRLSELARLRGMDPDVIKRMIHNVNFIADHFSSEEAQDDISNDWSYVAMVIDRLFLILFTIVNISGTVLIFMQAPTLYDRREPLPLPVATKPLGGDTMGNRYWYNGTI